MANFSSQTMPTKIQIQHHHLTIYKL